MHHNAPTFFSVLRGQEPPRNELWTAHHMQPPEPLLSGLDPACSVPLLPTPPGRCECLGISSSAGDPPVSLRIVHILGVAPLTKTQTSAQTAYKTKISHGYLSTHFCAILAYQIKVTNTPKPKTNKARNNARPARPLTSLRKRWKKSTTYIFHCIEKLFLWTCSWPTVDPQIWESGHLILAAFETFWTQAAVTLVTSDKPQLPTAATQNIININNIQQLSKFYPMTVGILQPWLKIPKNDQNNLSLLGCSPIRFENSKYWNISSKKMQYPKSFGPSRTGLGIDQRLAPSWCHAYCVLAPF